MGKKKQKAKKNQPRSWTEGKEDYQEPHLNQRSPFEIYLNMGIIISGTTHDLEMLLSDLKGMKGIKTIYSRVSTNKLKILDDDTQEME